MELSKEDLKQILSDNEHLLGQTLQAMESRIIKRIDDAEEHLAAIVAETIAAPFTARFDELEQKLDYSERIRLIERRLARLEDDTKSSGFALRHSN
jgi:hypothetical protein